MPSPQRRLLALSTLLTLLGLAWPAAAQDQTEPTPRPEADVYLLAGQSNMAGSGQKTQLPPEEARPIEGVRLWNGESFELIDPGKTELRQGDNRFGPELGFARVMHAAQPDRTVYIIKFARSGQPLHAGFDRANWMGEAPGPNRGTFYPGESADDPNIGNHYRDMMRRAAAAFADLHEQGLEPRLRGVVWMQGEADAKHEISALQYAQSLARLKSRIEADLGSEPVPFVFGQVLPHEPAAERFTHRTEIRQAMANADMNSGHADAIPGCLMVPTENMPLNNDTVHYSTTGVLLLGRALGQGMLDALQQADKSDESDESDE